MFGTFSLLCENSQQNIRKVEIIAFSVYQSLLSVRADRTASESLKLPQLSLLESSQNMSQSWAANPWVPPEFPMKEGWLGFRNLNCQHSCMVTRMHTMQRVHWGDMGLEVMFEGSRKQKKGRLSKLDLELLGESKLLKKWLCEMDALPAWLRGPQ